MKKVSDIIPSQPHPLPSIIDLYNDVEWAAKQNDLNRLCSQEPSPKWVKEHPFIKGLKYIPIERIEWLLTNVFLKWWVEIKDVKVVANSVVVTVRLWVVDPITKKDIFQDGVGAVDIQTKKDAPATDFNQILPFAVMKSVPAAKSYAIKDAAEAYGRLFGKDVSRKDFIAYTNLDNKFDLSVIPCTQEQSQELYALLNTANITHDLNDEYVWRIQKGVSIDEYYIIRGELIDANTTALQKIQNGENVSQKEITKAVKAKMEDE